MKRDVRRPMTRNCLFHLERLIYLVCPVTSSEFCMHLVAAYSNLGQNSFIYRTRRSNEVNGYDSSEKFDRTWVPSWLLNRMKRVLKSETRLIWIWTTCGLPLTKPNRVVKPTIIRRNTHSFVGSKIMEYKVAFFSTCKLRILWEGSGA